jgi:hypothetical protein
MTATLLSFALVWSAELGGRRQSAKTVSNLYEGYYRNEKPLKMRHLSLFRNSPKRKNARDLSTL